jgi:uncharacterized protein (TIGR03435 family)
MKRMLALPILFGTLSLSAAHQAPAFEVATVKSNRSGAGVAGGCHGADTRLTAADLRLEVPLGRCRITSGRLDHMLSIAYGREIYRIQGGPDWMGFERFDLEAKVENPPTSTDRQLLLMLRDLLHERFRMKTHRETIDASGHALVIAKNGPKLKESTEDGARSLRISGAAIYKFDAIEQRNLNENTLIGQRVTMAQLVNALAGLPGSGPIVDKTGLTGSYDFKMTWEPSESISAVLQEQLGLRLDSQRVPVEVLVVDSAEKPVGD